jgi:hypothetical protein
MRLLALIDGNLWEMSSTLQTNCPCGMFLIKLFLIHGRSLLDIFSLSPQKKKQLLF